MGLLKEYLFSYFKKIGVVTDFHEFIVILFQDESIPRSGSIPNRFANDILPGYIKDQYNEYEGKSDEIIQFYETDLYKKVVDANSGYFEQFFYTIREGIQIYQNQENRLSLYQQIKEKKAIISPLMNSTLPADLIYRYIDVHIKTRQDSSLKPGEFSMILYVLIYYICFGFLSPRFSEMITGIDQDRNEYDQVIVNEYGHTAINSYPAIYYLAHKEKPNSIALYEVADLEFYGRGPSGRVDKNKAYDYYKRSLECSAFNAAAAFSIGYMQYYYHTREMHGMKIDELDNLSDSQRKQLAFQNIMSAFQCGSHSAANTLAVMCDDQEIPYYLRAQCLSKEQYLIYAAQGTNFYAKNRLGHHYYDKAKMETNPQARHELLEKACKMIQDAYEISHAYYNQIPIYQFEVNEEQLELKIIELASRMREHWAMNDLGLYFYHLDQKDIAFRYFYLDANAKNDLACYHLLTLYFDAQNIDIKDYYLDLTLEEIEEKKQYYKSVCAASKNKLIIQYMESLYD